MLRLAISRNSPILSKQLTAIIQPNAVNCLAHHQLPIIKNNLRLFSLTTARFCEANEDKTDEPAEDAEEEQTKGLHRLFSRYAGTARDRSNVIPYERSIEYLKSGSYEATYGNKKVWELYRRVHKGQLPKFLTRKTCIRGKVIVTGSPCPICRDEYLVLHHKNLELLKQFISPYTGEILSFTKTGLCQRQHTQLEVCIERAYDQGLLEFEVPFREFDYSDYYDVYKKPMFSAKHEH